MADTDSTTLDTSAPPVKSKSADVFILDDIRRLRDIESQKEKELGPAREQFQKNYETERADVQRKRDAIEPVDVQPWKEKPAQRDPLEVFGSAGSVFAVLASALTHQPAINALNGAAAAMNAIKNNDREAYKTAFEAWKENTQLALDRHRVQYEDYRAAMDMMTTDMTAGATMLREIAAKYGDRALEITTEAGLWHDMESMQIARNNSALAWAEAAPRLEEAHDLRLALMADPDISAFKKKVAAGQRPTPEEQQKYLTANQRIRSEFNFGKTTSLSQQEGKAVEELVAQGTSRTEAIRRVKEAANPGTANFGKLVDSTVNQADDLIKMIDANPNVVGTRGMISGAIATVKGIIDPRANVDESRQQFETAMTNFRTQVNLAISTSKYLSAQRKADIVKAVPGLETFESAQDAKTAIAQVKALLQGARSEIQSDDDMGNKLRDMSDDELKKALGLQ